MKKVFCFIVIVFLISAQTLYSQTEKGNIYLGLDGAVSLNSFKNKVKSDDSEEETQSSFQFSLAPSVGYFLIDGLVVGTNITYSNSRTTVDLINFTGQNEVTFINNQLFGSLFTRYYFKGDKILPYLTASAGIGTNTSKTQEGGSDSESKSELFTIGGGAGIAIILGKHVTFDVGLDYSSFNVKNKEDNPNNTRSIQTGISLSTGFSVYLDRKNKQNTNSGN